MKISFIIIGYNVSWILEKVLISVITATRESKLSNYEIIYIDSNSSDKSLEIASKYRIVTSYVIYGKKNAAIARNIGAKESKGDILFFLDGDMELKSEFLREILNNKSLLVYSCLTGHLIDYLYDKYKNYIKQKPRTYSQSLPVKSIKISTNGGAFVILKKYWEGVGGMKTKFKSNEDYDFSLRLKYYGLSLIRLPTLYAHHHTVDYRDENRMWTLLANGSSTYSPILWRNHLQNYKIIPHFIRRFYTALILMIFLLSIGLFIKDAKYILFLYLIILIIKVIFNTIKAIGKKRIFLIYFFKRLIYQTSCDIIFIVSFLFYYPKENVLEYKKVNTK